MSLFYYEYGDLWLGNVMDWNMSEWKVSGNRSWVMLMVVLLCFARSRKMKPSSNFVRFVHEMLPLFLFLLLAEWIYMILLCTSNRIKGMYSCDCLF